MISQDLGQSGGSHMPWYALRVKSKHEQVASLHLRSRGFEEFSASYKVERQWSDRKKTVEASLFPGYVFCRLDVEDRLPVLTVPGVVDIVGFGGVPTSVPEEEVARVRAMLNSGLVTMPWPFLTVGDVVLIEQGPLTGVEGILVEIKGRYRIVVSVNLLQRSVSCEIERSWVRPVKPPVSTEVPQRTSRPDKSRPVVDSAMLKS